ncbi:MAG: hypothetical protein H6741_31650 [Alphaproteobacteria bacterium]|nr:hypothetical protein [Alphaproteobacteria bacterium]MCB9797267.1 hypothetical protein [Alphaproteobacteria bacterium]
MTLRVVSYAINGRGMGHLVRQLSILRWMRRLCGAMDQKLEAWVLTSSEADTLARREGFPALKMPSKAMIRDAGLPPERYLPVARTWVLNAIAGLQPDLLLVDTFAGGSFGELVASLEMARKRVLVARRVKPEFAEADPYQELVALYDEVIVPDARGSGPILIRDPHELLEREAARAALGVPEGKRAVYLSLGGGGDASAPGALPRLARQLREAGWHVVVGAGPLYEGPELRGEGLTWLDRYTPVELLPGVDAAVSAAGYNSFHELMLAGVPTVFLPQPRVADDQRERAERAVAAGAGRVARTLAEVPALLEAVGDPAAARALVPPHGARRAALQALSTVLPAEDLAMADRLLSPDLLAVMERFSGREGPAKALELLRLLGGRTPREQARRRALLHELSDEGHPVPTLPEPEDLSGRVQDFITLCAALSLPLDEALHLLQGLRKKFPSADGAALLAACERLLPAWARFDDWMGAVSLLRAVPTQRTLDIAAFAEGMERWLADEDDLFDALRRFSRLEARGQRSVAEVLLALAEGAP